RAAVTGSDAAADELKLSWSEIKRSFNFATPLLGLVASMITVLGTALTIAVFTRTIRADLEFSSETIGLISGVLEPISGVVGALVGGVVADRVGVRKAMGGFMAGSALALLMFALMLGRSPTTAEIAVFACIHYGCFYAFNAAALGFYMTMSNPAIGATHFAIFMAGTNLTYAWASPAGGMIADRWGVATTYGIAAVCQLLAVAILPFCDPSVAERRFRSRDEADEPA
ncbi:MAG TPA: MFS transporter, partial [Polyangiaceae bacterium]|nr:MFS transporter [Polyangiaceae bacterium]